MDITIHPGKLSGTVHVIPSKSQAHRLLICAALADRPTVINCSETNRDMDATAACLNELGAGITRTEKGYYVLPISTLPEKATLHCRDSGSTLRFLLPVAGALGVDSTFILEGRLPQRPLSPLWEEMERMGCQLSWPTETTVRCQGKLIPGCYTIAGNISSQFITGLLMALPLLKDDSHISITGTLESKPYVDMTRSALQQFAINITDGWIPGGKKFHSPGELTVEGDWSNGAFWEAAKALGNPIFVQNLCSQSIQGDKAIMTLLPALNQHTEICAANIPDLVPILSIVAACRNGAVFTNIQRLRMKESDRVASIINMIQKLGGRAQETVDTLTVYGTGLSGGCVDSMNDHRIAMSAAIASTVCSGPVTIRDADCVQKSYPKFWDEFRRLGGNYEQHLR